MSVTKLHKNYETHPVTLNKHKVNSLRGGSWKLGGERGGEGRGGVVGSACYKVKRKEKKRQTTSKLVLGYRF